MKKKASRSLRSAKRSPKPASSAVVATKPYKRSVRWCWWCDMIIPEDQPVIGLTRVHDDKFFKWCVSCTNRVLGALQFQVHSYNMRQYRIPK